MVTLLGNSVCTSTLKHWQEAIALIKAYELLLPKNSHAEGSELTPRIYLQLHSKKISAVCLMFYDEVGQFSVELLDPQLNDSMLSLLNLQEIFRRGKLHSKEFSQAGVSLQNFLPCEKFPLHDMSVCGIKIEAVLASGDPNLQIKIEAMLCQWWP